MNLLAANNLEPGMVAGPGLTATQTFLYFVVAPVALFLVISAFAYATSTTRENRKKHKSVVEHID